LVNADGSVPAESLLPEHGVWEALFAPEGHSLVVRTRRERAPKVAA